jgi:hypothetical protein
MPGDQSADSTCRRASAVVIPLTPEAREVSRDEFVGQWRFGSGSH